jgi:hypothetical protein
MARRKIISLLKHTFIPHHGNEYKPHFFREHVILTLLIGSIFLLLTSFTVYIVIRTTSFGSSAVSSVLVDLTNQTRKKNNLPPLLYSTELTQAATLKGEDMSTRQYFSHFAPDGTSPWHWFEAVNYSYLFAGENLAINFRNSTDVEKAWMESPKHRDNILDKRYEDIGIATVPSTVNNKKVLFIVQLFGKQEPQDTPSLSSPTHFEKNASLFEKIFFNTTHYIYNAYVTLAVILIFALCLMIFIEIRTQHLLHIMYGVLLIIFVFICIGINSLLI